MFQQVHPQLLQWLAMHNQRHGLAAPPPGMGAGPIGAPMLGGPIGGAGDGGLPGPIVPAMTFAPHAILHHAIGALAPHFHAAIFRRG